MKTIKIAHLYYDLMNLYGENGNVRFLKYKLEEQDIKTEIHFLSIDDKIDFNKYDFYYIGTGSRENQELVLEDTIRTTKNLSKLDLELKLLIEYTNDNGEKKDIYYKTT